MDFKKILKCNGIPDPISKVTVVNASNPGDGFAVVHEFATVEFEACSSKKPLHLFVKRKTDKAAFNVMLDEWHTFQKEAQFYTEYLPMAREYCESMGQAALMSIYPKCYFAEDHMAVLENVGVTRNLVVLNKEERQDFKAATCALTNLARHHAISHSIICELGGGASFARRFPHLVFEPLLLDNVGELIGPTFERGVETSIKILESCRDVDGSVDALATLKSLRGKTVEKVLDGVEGSPGEFKVLIHGDYWNNNMMFRKSKHSEDFEDLVMLDFQEMKYASPCRDISMHLFTSVQSKVRREKFRHLLEIYLTALKDAGNGLGHPIEVSMKQLEESFCRHFHSGYFFGLSFSFIAQIAFKDANINELEDMRAVQRKREELIGKWVEDNPDRCREEVGYLIDYVRFYQELSKGLVV